MLDGEELDSLGTVCAPKCDMSTEARAPLMALKDERGQPVMEHLPQVVIVDVLCTVPGNWKQKHSTEQKGKGHKAAFDAESGTQWALHSCTVCFLDRASTFIGSITVKALNDR